MSTGSRLECHRIHSGDLAQVFFCCMEQFQTSLYMILCRMDILEARQGSCGFIDLRIVLHCAGTQRIESIVNTEGLFSQFGIVTADICL